MCDAVLVHTNNTPITQLVLIEMLSLSVMSISKLNLTKLLTINATKNWNDRSWHTCVRGHQD